MISDGGWRPTSIGPKASSVVLTKKVGTLVALNGAIIGGAIIQTAF